MTIKGLHYQHAGIWARRRVAGALVLGALAACTAPHTPAPPSLQLPDHIKVRAGGRVATVPLEDYVLGSVLAEVSPVDESSRAAARIFEVQSVMARSYAVAHRGRHRQEGFDVCDSTHCQLYDPARIRTSRFSAIARDAVRRTAGQVLIYLRRPADALYHADCGGSTAAADAVWGGPAVPYLKPSPDDQPSLAHRRWRHEIPAARLREALNRDRRSRIGGRLEVVEVAVRDASGRAATVVVRGEQHRRLRGEDFRAIVNQALGERTLQSTKLSIARAGDTFVFTGSGFGHGVGLCQLGAAARARRGEAVEQILHAYFEGAGVVRVR